MRALATTPPHTLSGFTGAPDTMRAMVRAVQGPRGEQSVLVRRMTEDVVREIYPKDYLGEIIAIRQWVATNLRYANDPVHVEYIGDPQRLAEDIQAHGKAVGDCDDIASLIACMALQVGRVAEFVCVGFGAPHEYSHVWTRVLESKSGKWVCCDPVAGLTEREMLGRVASFECWSLDERPEHGPVEVFP